LHEFADEAVNLCEEIIAAGVWPVADEGGRVLGQVIFSRRAGPMPKVAINQQGQPTQVVAPACKLQVAQEVLKPKLN
jgi:hypothetical protein